MLPHLTQRIAGLAEKKLTFAHYTAATTAYKILSSREIWLNNITGANDYSELQHAKACLLKSLELSENKDRIGEIWNSFSVSENEFSLENYINDNQAARYTETYVFCVSEQEISETNPENKLGRLSMWRAYGGSKNVSILFNTDLMIKLSSDHIFTPVLYCDPEDFNPYFDRFLAFLEDYREEIKRESKDTFIDIVKSAVEILLVSTKHPGFAEEREWRLVRSRAVGPGYLPNPTTELVGSSISRVHKTPLVQSEHLSNDDFAQMLDRVIIGPTTHPYPSGMAFIELVGTLGPIRMDPAVFISEIPIRRE